MAMVMVIWAAAAEVIIMDGAEDAVTTTAGHAVNITTGIETRTGGRFLAAFLWASTICDWTGH